MQSFVLRVRGAMHIPDGLLSLPVASTCAVLAAGAVSAAAVRARGEMKVQAVALLGVTAAFVFAAQMLNFPVAGGTSGHLLGGVLAAVLVGPSAAVVVMTAVLLLQCLVFGDGGLLALGANVLNMAVIHPLVGFALYRAFAGSTPGAARRLTSLAFASWATTLVAAATCAGELTLSGTAAGTLVFPAMVGTHILVGLGEAVISALVIAAVLRLRPELLLPSATVIRPAAVIVPGLTVAVALALFVSPFACTWPDGLERVVERLGLESANARLDVPAPLRDYTIPGLGGHLSTAGAALAGTMLVFALSLAIGTTLAPRPRAS